MIYSTHLFRHLRFTIGQNIQHLRNERKISLHKLSDLTNIAVKSLDCYEIGKNEIHLYELLKIACVLEVGITELVA